MNEATPATAAVANASSGDSADAPSRVDVRAILNDAVAQAGRALGAIRAYVTAQDSAGNTVLEAQWVARGVQPYSGAPHRLATANLARREGRTVVVSDVATAPEYDDPTLGGRESVVAAGAYAALATPVLFGRHVAGVLGFHRSEPGEWSASEVELAEGVAREVALALHLARLLDETEARLEQASALFEAARVVTGELRLEAVLKRLVMALARLLHADAADCYLLDKPRNMLRCTAAFKLDASLVHWEFPADEGLAGEALRSAHPISSRDHPELVAAAPHPAYAEFGSALVGPMLVGGDKQGVVGVSFRDPNRAFGEADANLLEAFAGLASVALRNAAAFEQSARQARVQRGFYRIASALAEPLSLHETLGAVAQSARAALGGSSAVALLTRDDGLEPVGPASVAPALAQLLRAASPDVAGALHEAAETGRLVAAPSLAQDERFEARWRRAVLLAGVRALLAIPVEDPAEPRRRLVAVLFDSEHSFADDDIELAQHLAGAAAGALQRSELFEIERSSRALAQHLARISGILAPELDPAAVLRAVAREVPALLAAEACVVYEPAGDEVVAVAGSAGAADAARGFRGGAAGLPAREVSESRAVVARDKATAEERALDPVLAAGLDSYLSVPLLAADGAVGAVISVYGAGERAWRPDEVDALRAVAASASAALANARLYQHVALENERNDAILAAIADGIVATDRDGRVVLWNAAAERITGVPASEAVARTPAAVLQRDLAADTDAVAADRTLSIRRGNQDVWLSLSEAVMHDPDGEVAGRVFAFRDVSAERVVEQMKSDFVSTVSHELRTPLTSIYGFSATLLREDLDFDDGEKRTFLSYIASESERLTRILDSLLQVARLDAGDLELRLAPIDVTRVIDEVVSDARAAAADGHRIVVDVAGKPPAACADEAKLKLVLDALVDNAVRYSPGGGTVTVAVRGRRDTVELRVSDEGIGIAPADEARLFTRFYRGAGSGVNGQRGPGLSLFIARGLVTAMGGRISVASTAGKGSSFLVELPVA
jgi:PAS domain S-box-containing protein